jgi:iron complex transport system substrate-binding protein
VEFVGSTPFHFFEDGSLSGRAVGREGAVMSRARRTLCALVLCFIVVGASCSDLPEPTPAATPGQAASFPVIVEAANGTVQIAARPEAIVSLSASATEDLFAIGAGEQVVAVDDQSNFPSQAPVTDLSGYEPNVEAILSYAPDLVVTAGDPGDLEPALEAAGVPMLLEPAAADLDEALAQIERLGEATGHASAATEVVTSIRARIDEIVATADAGSSPPSIYHELDDTYYSVTSSTFIGQVYETLGAINIADEAKGAGSGYPQLSAEYIVESDPDVIFLADARCCGQTPRIVADRPGWDRIAAVRRQAIVELDEDIASRWGPRVVELYEVVAEALSASAA